MNQNNSWNREMSMSSRDIYITKICRNEKIRETGLGIWKASYNKTGKTYIYNLFEYR